MSFRILSFDGGGICGLITLQVLRRLQKESPLLVENADLLAGTSTGGLISLGLAQGDEVEDLIDLYEKKGPVIFDKATLGAGGLVHCRYDNRQYQKLLWNHFGTRRLGDLHQKVVVPAFCVNSAVKRVHRWKPKVFVSFPEGEVDRQELCAKVALYTSAAPTYFPIADYYIDGGVMANNPSMCALASALAMGEKLEDIRLLSFGTGLYPQFVNSKDGAWGLSQWGKTLVDIFMGGTELIPDYQCWAILRERYIRVEPIMPKKISLDDWRACAELNAIAMEFDIGPTVEWLKQEWQRDQTK
jgi:patatin-like phospholipase/acyl hydrolase